MLRPFHRWPIAVAAGVSLWLAGMPEVASGAPIPHSMEYAFFSQSTARQAGNGLGHTVALDGNTLALGSPYDDIGGADSGIVNIYNAATGALLHQLENPNPSKESYFGWSIAVSGTRVVIGAPEDDSGSNDTGIAYVYDMSSATPTVPVFVLENPDPGQNDTFGWSVAIDGARVVVGVPEGDSGQLDAGCAYAYDLSSATPSVPVYQFDNPNSGGENFGVSVAVSGARVVVGAAPDDAGGDSCRAYVFNLTSATPETPQVVLADESPTTNDHFGLVVDISGATVVVAAPQEDTGAQNAGTCYVYNVASGTPAVPIVTIHNPAPALNDTFGSSMAVDGARLMVGSHLDDQGGTDTGRAYVFDLASGTPSVPAHTIDNPTPVNNDFFGCSVAISGTRLAAGAHGDNTGASDAGSAYVFELTSGTPTAPVFSLNTPSPSSDEEFGTSVAISGTMVVVGCHHDDKGASNAGSVYVHDFTSNTPQLPVLTIDNPAPVLNDYFGASVAASGNLIIVAAYQDDGGATNAGTVYVYNRTSATPATPVFTIPNPTPQAQDQFGNAIAVSGSILVVGAFKNDAGALDAGSAYVYNLASPTPTVPIMTLDNPEPNADDWFGYSVGISGSLVAIGAYGDDAGAINSGSVYIYNTASGTPTLPVAILRNPGPGTDDWFGYSVGISGNNVLVGSPMDESGEPDSGSAYVFDLGTPGIPLATLNNPAPEPEDYFGISVAISGTRLVVGASEVDLGASDTGSAYVYELTSSTPEVSVDILDNLDKAQGDWFGYSTAIDGTNIVVGAPLDDGNTVNRGAAFVFDPDPPSPEMQVEQPPGTGLISGAASIHFGDAAMGTSGDVQTVVIRNIGTAVLELTSISLFAGNVGDFFLNVPALPVVLQVDQSVSFAVTFAPVAADSRVATLRILSNAVASSPFNITLTGQALSPTNDTDGDGLNDVAELQLEALGFDWQVNDEELLAILRSGANATGLYSTAQLQAMHSGMPMLPRDPVTGDFILKVAVKKSVNLADFELFPITQPQMTIDAQGGAEFRFPPPGSKAFFRLEPR